MKRPQILISTAMLIIVLVYACGSTIRTLDASLVTITIGHGQTTAVLRAEKATPGTRLLHFLAGAKLTPKAHAAVPAEVKVVVVTASAPDMRTMVTVVPVAGQMDISVTLEVPNGKGRNFLVEGFNDASAVVYSGRATVDLTGDPVSLTIDLAAVVVDTQPPTFGGLALVSDVTATTARLSWSAATDDSTPSSGIVYLVFQATTSTGEIYSSPAYTTPAGATSYTVTGLADGTIYYFVVRARDAAGNRDSNAVERSATTPDATPPVFAGLTAIANATGTTAQLSWSAATDNVTQPTGMVYLIYRASSPSGQAYGTPTYTTTIGATSHTVADLAPNTTYYFVVRARDAAGNIDSNTVERTTTTADAIPPAFAGLSLVTNVTYTGMQLSWSPAVDNVTPQANIVYLIYQSATAGGESYAAPSYTTAPNAASYTVGGLTPGTAYYFVVRARDAAGNIDGNTVERSQAQPGLNVAITGDDAAGDGSSANPYRTITKALSLTLGSEAIFVSQGTYSAVVGAGPGSETFPLQLKTGTVLYCTGPNHSTVIDDAGSTVNGTGVVVGAQGAVIEGCAIDSLNPFYQAAVDDDGFDMTISNANLISYGMIGMRYNGVIFSGNSTLKDTLVRDFALGDGVGAGVVINGGAALVTGSTITGNEHGIQITAGNPTLDGNTILGSNGNGIQMEGGAAVISNNRVQSNPTGVFVQGGSAVISGNQIEFNTTGVLVSNTSPTITGNTIRKNVDGVTVSGSAGTSPRVNGNSIYCNANFDLDATGAMDPFSASNNAWDHEPPTAVIPTVAACSAGTDICYNTPGPAFTPYNAAAIDACLP